MCPEICTCNTLEKNARYHVSCDGEHITSLRELAVILPEGTTHL